jgi:hypothetical protein
MAPCNLVEISRHFVGITASISRVKEKAKRWECEAIKIYWVVSPWDTYICVHILLESMVKGNSLMRSVDKILQTTRRHIARNVTVNNDGVQTSHLKQLNSVAWVRERTIRTEQPSLVGEVSANFWGYWVPRGQRDGSLRQYSRLSSSSTVLMSLCGPRSRPSTSQKI